MNNLHSQLIVQPAIRVYLRSFIFSPMGPHFEVIFPLFDFLLYATDALNNDLVLIEA